jgi:hypothetical protein
MNPTYMEINTTDRLGWPLSEHARTTKRNHTVDELWGDLPPEKRVYDAFTIRPVISNYVPKDNLKLTDAHMKAAYMGYSMRVAENNKNKRWWEYKRFKGTFDQMRFELHKLLLRWKVIL